MSSYTNVTGIPLSLAVYLATDHYDHDPETISATALIKPVKQVILASRVPAHQRTTDILQLVKSRMGTSIHSGIELAWAGGHYKQAMRKLGYPESVIDKVVINPDPDNLPVGAIPVYMEKRERRSIGGRVVSGKYDFIAEGRLEDFKTTSTYVWVKGTRDTSHQLQGSIYRWLNPKIITESYMVIQYLFSDWKQGMTKSPGYPQRPVEPYRIPLLSLDDTEDYILAKLQLLDRLKNAPEDSMPTCSEADLWRDAPVWKYYKDPAKTTRSTKNYDNKEEANLRAAQEGGIVLEKPGEVRACNYCAALPVCQQAKGYVEDGSLILAR